jgi:DNA invertase Pin-like site-specific DNA recombinase
MKVAIYARVSTDDKGQDPLNQLLQLRDFASKQPGWAVMREYVDRASGKTADRREFQAMLREGARHKFDVLLFWSLDRLTREGTWMTLCYLRQLTAAGVKYKSLTEQYIDSLGPFSEAIVGIIGAVAQQERIRLSERTKAGMARARAAGKRFGPQPKNVNVAQLRRLRAKGLSVSAIAKRTRLSRTMVWDRLNTPSALVSARWQWVG